MHMVVFVVQEEQKNSEQKRNPVYDQLKTVMPDTFKEITGGIDDPELMRLMDGYCFEAEEYMEFIPYDKTEIETFMKEYQTGVMDAYKFCDKYFSTLLYHHDNEMKKLLQDRQPDISFQNNISTINVTNINVTKPEEYIVFSEYEFVKIYSLKNHDIEYCKNVPIKDVFTMDEYMYNEYGLSKQNGEYGYIENPNARIDWYVVGGRWNNMLHCKNGTCTNRALIDEIIFSHDLSITDIPEANMTKNKEIWDCLSAPIMDLNKPLKEYYMEASLDSDEDIINVYGTFDNFCNQIVKTVSVPSCILYPEKDTGCYIWDESGAWDAKSYRNWCFNRVPKIIEDLKSRNKKYMITVVDCHF